MLSFKITQIRSVIKTDGSKLFADVLVSDSGADAKECTAIIRGCETELVSKTGSDFMPLKTGDEDELRLQINQKCWELFDRSIAQVLQPGAKLN